MHLCQSANKNDGIIKYYNIYLKTKITYYFQYSDTVVHK